MTPEEIVDIWAEEKSSSILHDYACTREDLLKLATRLQREAVEKTLLFVYKFLFEEIKSPYQAIAVSKLNPEKVLGE